MPNTSTFVTLKLDFTDLIMNGSLYETNRHSLRHNTYITLKHVSLQVVTARRGPVWRRSAKENFLIKNMNSMLEILMQNDSIYVHDYN
jgi:hypothetical protein